MSPLEFIAGGVREWLESFTAPSSEASVVFGIIVTILYMGVVAHLIIKRISRLNTKDYITRFRKWVFIILVTVFATTIPVLWYLFARLLGSDTEDLRNFATTMARIGPLLLVLGLEIGDSIIDRISARARKDHPDEEK